MLELIKLDIGMVFSEANRNQETSAFLTLKNVKSNFAR